MLPRCVTVRPIYFERYSRECLYVVAYMILLPDAGGGSAWFAERLHGTLFSLATRAIGEACLMMSPNAGPYLPETALEYESSYHIYSEACDRLGYPCAPCPNWIINNPDTPKQEAAS